MKIKEANTVKLRIVVSYERERDGVRDIAG